MGANTLSGNIIGGFPSTETRIYAAAGNTTFSGTVTSGTATHSIVVTVRDSYNCASTKNYSLIVQSRDYGDLSSLPAAASTIVSGLRMGSVATDADPATQTNASATADDTAGTDDEDGVTFSPMIMGSSSLITLKVTNSTGSPAYINGWIDFEGNGTMGAGEQVVSDQVVATGATDLSVDLTVPVPAVSFEGNVAARFRLTSTATPGVSGVAGNGEVEDYLVQICTPKACGKTFVTQN